MLPSLGKEFDASASTGEAAAVDDLHRTRCCRRNNGLNSEAWKARSLAQAFLKADIDFKADEASTVLCFRKKKNLSGSGMSAGWISIAYLVACSHRGCLTAGRSGAPT